MSTVVAKTEQKEYIPRMDIHETYEAPAMTELGDLADLTQGSAQLLVDTDVVTTGSV
jgi:hypothetical protein